MSNLSTTASTASSVTWKEVDQDRFWEMLEILPPAFQAGFGFLVGEAYTHRTCDVTGQYRAAFSAFYEIGDRYFEASGPLTRAEFQAVKPDDVLAA